MTKVEYDLLAPDPTGPDEREALDYTDIANRVQAETGRSIWPRTVEIEERTPVTVPDEAVEAAVIGYVRNCDASSDDVDAAVEAWMADPELVDSVRAALESTLPHLSSGQGEADEFTPAMSHYLGQVIRERDAALSVIERVREALRVPHPMSKDRRSQDHYPKLVGDLLDLLPDPTERSNP